MALIPVKDLPRAKARLSPALDETGRHQLTTALYRDALAAALECPSVDRVGVVSRDEEVLELAAAAGAQALPEPGDLNSALDSAAQKLRVDSVDRILVIAADLPLVSSGAIETVAQSDAEVALVASGDGGTNALSCTPGAFAFQYGPGSAQAHKEAAWAADLEPVLLDVPDLALDIDTPDDLERLQRAIASGKKAGVHTTTALTSLGLVAGPGSTES